jgi:hypothetical protein
MGAPLGTKKSSGREGIYCGSGSRKVETHRFQAGLIFAKRAMQ